MGDITRLALPGLTRPRRISSALLRYRGPEEAEARLMAPGPPSRPPGQAPAPPVITLRRPSLTCLPLEPGLKCSDPLYRATFVPGGQSFNCNISKVSRSKSRKPTYCLKFSAIRMKNKVYLLCKAVNILSFAVLLM